MVTGELLGERVLRSTAQVNDVASESSKELRMDMGF